jgi:hypothetical protein
MSTAHRAEVNRVEDALVARASACSVGFSRRLSGQMDGDLQGAVRSQLRRVDDRGRVSVQTWANHPGPAASFRQRMLDALLPDLRYAARALRSSPGFAAVAILSLALGNGANTAIFSLIDSVLLKFLPVNHPEELVQVTMGPLEGTNFTNPISEQLRDRQDVFSGAFGGKRATPAATGSAASFSRRRRGIGSVKTGVIGVYPLPDGRGSLGRNRDRQGADSRSKTIC